MARGPQGRLGAATTADRNGAAATDLATVHATGLQTAYVSASGDYTASAEFPVVDRFANRFFLTGVMVESTTPVRAIVAFGNSITDGTASTVNANHRWPDVLARRLTDAGVGLAVLNQGIAGNRVLSDGLGISALARFERDVLSQPAVSHVIILIGINDIGFPSTAIEPNGIVRTAREIIAGYKQLIERAHLRGLKVIGSPLTPFENAAANGPDAFSPETRRQSVKPSITGFGPAGPSTQSSISKRPSPIRPIPQRSHPSSTAATISILTMLATRRWRTRSI